MKKSKNKFIGLFSCFVLAAVFAVTFTVNTSEKERENNQQEANANEQESLAEADEKEQEASPVILNKNAASSEDKKQESENKEMENTEESQSPKEDYTYNYDDEAEETLLSDDELTFALPVNGEIAMDYSKDKLVYDSTLDQYRTNESICYSAEKGTVVGAAAQGTVESITKDRQKGTSVTVFHGDGWRTTYSQLSEDVAVAQGDIVQKGQTLGYVGEPSPYSAALGSHLEFSMTLDGNSIDPKTALVE